MIMGHADTRAMFAMRLENRVEAMIENGELDPDEADEYFEREMDDWDWGYSDQMYDIAKDREFGYE